MSEHLYEIAARYREILEMEGDTDDERAAIVNALDEAAGDFVGKAEAVAAYIRNCEGWADAIRAEEVRLAAKRRPLEKSAQFYRDYLAENLRRVNLKELRAGIFKMMIVPTKGSVSIIDEAIIPKEYFTTPAPIVSRAAIQCAIDEGRTVPGVEVVPGESLRIR